MHLDRDELELYGLKRLPQARVEEIEDYLLICSTCQAIVTEEMVFAAAMTRALQITQETFFEVHETEKDGPVEVSVRSEGDRWVGRITAERVHSTGCCWAPTHDEAVWRVREDFDAMYPEHRCGDSCFRSVRAKRFPERH
jgi:hypothetical protein